jgi:hypothetical protein
MAARPEIAEERNPFRAIDIPASLDYVVKHR